MEENSFRLLIPKREPPCIKVINFDREITLNENYECVLTQKVNTTYIHAIVDGKPKTYIYLYGELHDVDDAVNGKLTITVDKE